MIKASLLDYSVFQVHCPSKDLFCDPQLLDVVDQSLSKLDGTNHKAREQVGHVLSTVGHTTRQIFQHENVKNLMIWCLDEAFGIRDHFGKPNARTIDVKRIWFNKMSMHAYGIRHNHENTLDGVGIFYLKAPSECATLQFFENELSDHVLLQVEPCEGLLVLHSPLLWHAITPHLSTEPRIVMVFEFNYV